MKRCVIICIALMFIISIVVFFNTMYNVKDNIILGINYENVENINITTNGLFGQKNDTININLTEKSDIRKFINKLYKIKLYKSSDKKFGQRDFTTVIDINLYDGSTIKIYMVSIQVRVEMIASGEINRSSELYYISPLSWLKLVYN